MINFVFGRKEKNFSYKGEVFFDRYHFIYASLKLTVDTGMFSGTYTEGKKEFYAYDKWSSAIQ